MVYLNNADLNHFKDIHLLIQLYITYKALKNHHPWGHEFHKFRRCFSAHYHHTLTLSGQIFGKILKQWFFTIWLTKPKPNERTLASGVMNITIYVEDSLLIIVMNSGWWLEMNYAFCLYDIYSPRGHEFHNVCRGFPA